MYRCYFCGSRDSMPPFRRAARVFMLTMILPSLQWRFCRSCARHFLVLRRKRRR